MSEYGDNKIVASADCIDSLLIGLHRTCFPNAVMQAVLKTEAFKSNIPPVSELNLIQLNKIRYRERKDIHYAMTSLFSALHGTNRPVAFILRGNKDSVSIYLGFWKNSSDESIEDFHAAIKGFIPGTEFAAVENNDSIWEELKSFSHINAVVGVPSEKQIFQDEKRTAPVEYGIERLADAMTSDNYVLMITAQPVFTEKAASYFENISSLLDYAHRLVKTSEQVSVGIQNGQQYSEGTNIGGSKQHGTQESQGETLTDAPWILKRWGKGIKKFFVGGDSPSKQTSKQVGTQFSEGSQWGKNISSSRNIGTTESKAQTVEYVNHQAIFAEELLKMIQNRLKNGIGEGLWKTNILFLSDREESTTKGCNILRGMWSGAQSHQDPIRFIELKELLKNSRNSLDNALALMNNSLIEDHPLGLAYSGGYTWLTSNELAIEANLPYYELPSLSSENIVEYGRFLPSYDKSSQILLGDLVDRNIKTTSPVWMDTFRLNRHLFVTGLTGAGKSNTVRSILLELARLGIPFMVIEPVKSEYRLLNVELKERFKNGESKFDGLDVFSLSGNGSEKLVLNPFAFEIKPGEDMATALITHIDRLKAVFNSSLGMYSSMPYVLEEMIYKAYRNAGWDIETGKNKYFEIARQYLGLKEDAELRNLFLPTLSELAGLVDEAIKEFFPDKSDYGISLVGALKSRLNSLSRGAKGLLLNQKLSLPIQTLLKKPCVIELESFADNDEKAFIMALLLSRIYEFRSGKLANGLQHVLVIEEAHRLLAKPPQSGEHSANSRGKSVEVFSDMLAEIRAYGQGIVIADQIPAKLIPDVIKNTDIKIVHRLMAKEDRESVGTAMNLSEQQINDLNRATPGLATVSFDGLNNAIRVQIRNVPLQSKLTQDYSNVKRVNPMTKYKQLVFLTNEDAKSEDDRTYEPSEYSLWLTIRLFFIAAIYGKWEILVKFRRKIVHKNAENGYKARIEKDNLWSCIADGAHLLAKVLVDKGLAYGEAEIIVAALVAFARPWSLEKPFQKEMDAFIRLVKKDIDFSDRKDAEKLDYLSLLLQIYADQANFQENIKAALNAGSVSDWSLLQQSLSEYAKDITFSTLPTDNTIATMQLYLRMIRCFRSNDEDIIKKAGLAYHSLEQLLRTQGHLVLTQEWMEV